MAGLGWGYGQQRRWGVLQPVLFPQRYQAEINDLENLGEMGSGTCGQVWKMRFRKTGHVIAVKVSQGPALLAGGRDSRPPTWLRPSLLLTLPAANAALGEQGGEQAYPHGPGRGAQEPRLSLHRAVLRHLHHQCEPPAPQAGAEEPLLPSTPQGPACFRAPPHLGVPSHLPPLPPQTDVFIAMELMGTCAEKLKKRMQGPIPERILGKMTVAVSGQAGARGARWVAPGPGPPSQCLLYPYPDREGSVLPEGEAWGHPP